MYSRYITYRTKFTVIIGHNIHFAPNRPYQLEQEMTGKEFSLTQKLFVRVESATKFEEKLLVSECNQLHRDPKVTLFPNQ